METQEADDRGLSHFREIRLRKAADEVVAVIVDGVRAGLWQIGDLLPRERDLAARLQVSPTTVREAISLLARAGVVTVKRGNGGGATIMTRSVPAHLLSEMEALGPSEIRSLLQMRRAIETTSAVLAGSAATEADFAQLEALAVGLTELVKAPEEFLALDFQFHLKVAESSRNEFLQSSLQEILSRYSTMRAQYPVGHVALERGIENQLTTLAAIRSRDEYRIVEAIADHLGDVEEHFLGERLGLWGRSE